MSKKYDVINPVVDKGKEVVADGVSKVIGKAVTDYVKVTINKYPLQTVAILGAASGVYLLFQNAQSKPKHET